MPPFAPLLQELRQHRTGNPVTTLLVALLLRWLTALFQGLSELAERVKSGEFQPHPIQSRPVQQGQIPQATGRPARPQASRWPAMERPGAQASLVQPEAPEPATARVPAGHIPPRRPGARSLRPAIAGVRPRHKPPGVEKPHRKPAPCHAQIVTIRQR